MNREISLESNNMVQLLQLREAKDTLNHRIQRKLHVTDDFINRLGLEKELEGHTGCVNCLEWNESGKILASASDDVQVILWDPFLHRKIHTVQTGHQGNIFSVKFLPKSSDSVVVTGAGDCRIQVHDILLGESTQVCNCHAGRVKRLATAPNVPNVFWSAAEDGLIMQFDLRAPHSCSTRELNVLINLLNHMGPYAEAKCLSINPVRPELLAVGANDPYVRLYDRRMIKPTTFQFSTHAAWMRQGAPFREEQEDNLPASCVQYFVAGHLPLKQHDFRKRYRNLASTYLTFSSDGNELLVNLGGEQIYLFDINNRKMAKTFDMKGVDINDLKTCKEHCQTSNGYSNGYRTANGFSAASNGITKSSNGMSTFCQSASNNIGGSSKKNFFPKKVEALKLRANDAFEKQHYTLAISIYNKAISMCPNHAILYGNRAAAYMKRSWDGDVYAALRDCHTALQLDPDHIKAHFRLARCLLELHWTQEAWDCLQVFKSKFPDHAQSHACKALTKDIQTATSKPDTEMESEEQDGNGTSREGGDNPAGNIMSPGKDAMSSQERIWREESSDYELRFCGHCNTTTDIKEANFFGSQGQFIVAGSDDGSFFIWDRRTTNIRRVLRGDESIVNCLQPHPSYCLLATSGIDPIVRLWSPRPEDGSKNEREVIDMDDVASANQKRMNADPFEVMLMNMGYRITSVQGEEGDGSDETRETPPINCRTS